MGWMLNLIYLAGWIVAAPLLVWRRATRGKGVAGLWTKWTGQVPDLRGQPTIWLHAVSVGEVVVLGSIAPRLRAAFPGHRLAVSTTTATGLAVARQRFPQTPVFYCPFDFTWSVRRALRRLEPRLIVLAELELWPNLIRLAARRSIPLAVINGRLSAASFRNYRRGAWLTRPIFRRLSWVGTQSTTSAQRFIACGARPERVTLTGNVKFDGAESDRGNPRTAALARLLPDAGETRRVLWLAGSTQAPEERIAASVAATVRREYPELRLAIAPRHPERAAEVERDLTGAGWRVVRRSHLREPLGHWPPDQLLLIDTVGELSAWWGLADLAFVGGSLGDRGGQNMIEPAAYGCAVAFGPNTWNFADAVALLQHSEAVRVVRDEDELREFIRRGLSDPAARHALGERGRRAVAAQRGAVATTLDGLARLLEQMPPERQAA